ncbi:MAG TPA: glycosyltransferase family 87 protein [Tepidisphaeraceae bacterium]|nr:glycosyltransferase family 87 protein [Tepidisphaeraceae bacterium]
MHKNQNPSALARFWSSAPAVWAVALIPFLIGGITCIEKLHRGPAHMGNLHVFRDAAIALSHGRDIYRSGNGEYVYPPLIAFLAQPLGWIPLVWAAAVMLVVNLGAAIFALKIACNEMLERLTGRTTALAVAQVALIAAWLTTDHIRSELNAWETNIWMLLMFVLALRWSDRKPLLSGIALGFAFNIKYLPIVFVPYLILRRRWAILVSFIVSSVFFAFLPAVSMGWSRDFAAVVKSDSGIARLLGIHLPASASANTLPFTSLKSISIPSAIGRMTHLPETYAVAIATAFAAVVLLFWFLLYRQRDLPLLKWPDAGSQTIQSFRKLFALEWAGIILLALAFSPYTNSPHLYLLLIVNAAVASLLLFSPAGTNSLPLLIASLILFLGTILPPGGNTFRGAELGWKSAGVAGWCMYLLAFPLLWIGLRRFRQAGTNQSKPYNLVQFIECPRTFALNKMDHFPADSPVVSTSNRPVSGSITKPCTTTSFGNSG